jgi:hypothetical protein
LLPRVKCAHHYIRLGVFARSDIEWWSRALVLFHGSTPFPSDVPIPVFAFSTDACLVGGGGYFLGDWYYTNWQCDYPALLEMNINVLELACIRLAAERWGMHWSGQHVLVRSDNVSSVQAINNTTSRSLDLLAEIKQIFWLSVRYNFRITASHIAGDLNITSDRISRLHDLSCAWDVRKILPVMPVVLCNTHMSYGAFLSLQRAWSLQV